MEIQEEREEIHEVIPVKEEIVQKEAEKVIVEGNFSHSNILSFHLHITF